MPFDLSVIRDDVTYSLTAGTPYKLASAEGLAGPAVTRATMRAPGQDGDTDYGYHLEPRLITLAVQFTATSGSVLDGYRDTFMDVFRPERSVSFSNPTGDPRFQAHTPLTLQVTRDDGEVRRIDCYATGPADMPLVTAHRPGNLQRAVVTLVAPNPTWYGTVEYVNQFPVINSGTVVGSGTVVYGGHYYGDVVYAGWPRSSGSITFRNVTAGGTLTFTTNLSSYRNFEIDTAASFSGEPGENTIPPTTFDYSVLRLLPDPIATGGTNVISVTSPLPLAGGGTAITIFHRRRYLSY